MEVLNNINQILTTFDIFYKLPFSLIEAFISMTFFLTIFNITANRKSKILYVFISSIISIFNEFLIPNPFNTFMNAISVFLLIIIIFKLTPFKALISLVLSIATLGAISTLILNPYITILNIDTEQLSNIPIYNIGHLLSTDIIYCIIIFILKIKNIKINLLEELDKNNKNIIFSNSILGFITLIIQACITFYYVDNLPIIITFLSFLSLLAYFGISIYSLTSVMKLTLTTKKLESAEEYNKTLRILHDNVRGFKHDFDNIVTTIGGYVRTNDMEGLKSYYLQLEDDCQRVNNLYLLNPEIINNPRYLQSTY